MFSFNLIQQFSVMAACVVLLAAPAMVFGQRRQQESPVRVGIVGLVHSHVHGILGRAIRGDIEIVGIVEQNREYARKLMNQHGYSMDLVHASLEEMLEQSHPDAVAVFTSILDHTHVVEVCAPLGVHVMVEKPLAVNLEHAQRMAKAARHGGIHLLTNYETTWYATVHDVYDRLRSGQLGPVRKMVFHDGHPGPREIGVDPEFLDWLIDPARNGAGALADFGCYGADLMTWLMECQRPLSVTAISQQLKPQDYPLVEDEATIVVTYPGAQGIIQASWNWPFNRKDMEIYGKSGYAIADNASTVRVRIAGDSSEKRVKPDPLPVGRNDPFAYLAAVVRGDLEPGKDLSSLEVNLIAMEILDAAMRSARSGKTIDLR